jgi:hypothetical protein
MGLFFKNVFFLGATCWLLYIWIIGERMDDLLLAIPLFFVTMVWLMRHGRKKESLEADVEEPKVSIYAKKEARGWGYVIFFGLIIAWFVYASNFKEETLPSEGAHAKCVRSTNIVAGELMDEAREDPSIWLYEYDNIYQYEDGLRKLLYWQCMALESALR